MDKNRVPISIVVISLPESTARRQSVARQLDPTGLAWSFFDAIKPAGPDSPPPEYDARKRLKFSGYPMSSGEIGNFLSHRAVWRDIVARGRPCLVLEDDFVIREGIYLDGLLGSIEALLGQFAFIRLHGHFPVRSKVIQPLGDTGMAVVKSFRDPSSVMAYVLTPAAAERLLEVSSRFFVPADDMLGWSWLHGLRIVSIIPYPVAEAGEALPQVIGDRRKPRLSFMSKIRREAYRAPFGIRKRIHELTRYVLP